jgi:hypothetical protein
MSKLQSPFGFGAQIFSKFPLMGHVVEIIIGSAGQDEQKNQ